MTAAGSRWRGVIPGAYSAGVYPIEYYFELRESAARAVLFPGFGGGRVNMPYFVVRSVG